VQCEDRVCSLDAGSSTASDGSIASYDWSFGDGATAIGGAVTHEYARDGHYTVTLKVTDSNKSSGVSKRTIEVVAGDPLTLQATLVDHKRSTALLEWSGARDDRLTVFRDGQRVATVRDLGKFFDREVKASGPSVRYRVCETSGERCSNPVKLMLGK
jgi:PKD repeat protein